MGSDKFVRSLVEVHGSAAAHKRVRSPKIEDKRLIATLVKARGSGRLVPVLGAGISIPSGVPRWDELVRQSAMELLKSAPHVDDALVALGRPLTVQVRTLENLAGLRASFRSILSRVLYRELDDSKPNVNADAVARLVLGLDGGRKVTDVITYNFDDLIERRLSAFGKTLHPPVKIASVCSTASYEKLARASGVRIYHPHGYLPRNATSSLLLTAPIVFSEEDYHRSFLGNAYWANRVQLDVFSTATCLFVGSSFNDGNMRRLLDYARLQSRDGATQPSHVALMQASTNPHQNALLQTDLKALGVTPLWVRSYGDIPRVLARIK